METLSNAEKERRRLKITDEIQELAIELNHLSMFEQRFFMFSDEKPKVLKEYLAKRKEIKQYLPDINDLVMNNTIYVVFDIHAHVQKHLQFMKVPESMTLFKLMTSDYGTISCPHTERRQYIKHVIDFRTKHRNTKYTKRNNIKFFKMLMKEMIQPLQESIDMRLSELRKVTQKKEFTQNNLQKIGYGSMTVKHVKKMINANELLHIHSFLDSSKKIVKKDYYIDLNYPDDWNQINIIHPKYPKINLVDYLDIKVVQQHWLQFNMSDIFDLFKHVPYVFLLDFSCSNTVDNNNFKQFARNTEGNSITQEIKNYNNSSPYNILDEEEQHAEDARLKLLENAARTQAIEKAEVNFNKGYNNLMKSRNPFWRNSPGKNYNENTNKSSNKSWLRRALRFTRKLYN